MPKENEKEASVVQGIEILPVETLEDVIKFLRGEIKLTRNFETPQFVEPKYNVDFSEVKGQESVKRALEIAAARRS